MRCRAGGSGAAWHQAHGTRPGVCATGDVNAVLAAHLVATPAGSIRTFLKDSTISRNAKATMARRRAAGTRPQLGSAAAAGLPGGHRGARIIPDLCPLREGPGAVPATHASAVCTATAFSPAQQRDGQGPSPVEVGPPRHWGDGAQDDLQVPQPDTAPVHGAVRRRRSRHCCGTHQAKADGDQHRGGLDLPRAACLNARWALRWPLPDQRGTPARRRACASRSRPRRRQACPASPRALQPTIASGPRDCWRPGTPAGGCPSAHR